MLLTDTKRAFAYTQTEATTTLKSRTRTEGRGSRFSQLSEEDHLVWILTPSETQSSYTMASASSRRANRRLTRYSESQLPRASGRPSYTLSKTGSNTRNLLTRHSCTGMYRNFFAH